MIRIGIIGGTGLGSVLEEQLDPGQRAEINPKTPFGHPAAPIVMGEIDGTAIALLQRHGKHHQFSPTNVPYQANIFALKMAGCTHVIASGACGSLQKKIRPGELVLCDQVIDRTVLRHRSFYAMPEVGAAVHVEMADPFCPTMRAWLRESAASIPSSVHDHGTYICIEGPSFSTRAEAQFHRRMGGDVVGMTAMPECRLAREAEMAYALIALPTDDDCWKPGNTDSTLLETIIGNLEQATSSAIAMVSRALRNTEILERSPSPAHTALNNAIWTDVDAIDPGVRTGLAPLWGRVVKG
ncbi:MAG: MTAP family purine nucleoside phosphorylase [Phycisphaerales bacterium]|nr:MTAP family purine nucleoside phosphorylase [Phycisphaerales bacterium]